MADIVKTWLKRKLTGLVSVQNVHMNADADMVIHMWSGVKINVHLINQAIKLRALKRVLQDASDMGIGTMFLVDGKMIPGDGTRVNLPDWLLAIHTLNHERIYTFNQDDHAITINQIHFEQVIGQNEYKAWYGPSVKFEKLRFFRTSVKPRFLKGDWLIADFGSHAFWKNTDYRAYRSKRDAEFFRERTTNWQEWSGYQTWAGNYERQTNGGKRAADEKSTSPLRAHLETCYRILGIEEHTPREEAKRAFRKLAITFHPDTSQLPRQEAEEKFRAINAAYEYVKAAKGW